MINKEYLKVFLCFLVATLLTSCLVWGNEKLRDDLTFFDESEVDISLVGFKTLTEQTYFHGLSINSMRYYRPLCRYLYRLENVAFKGRLNLYHLLNLIVHSLLLTAVYYLLRRWGATWQGAVFVTLFAGLHPITHAYWVYMTGLIDITASLSMVLALLFVNQNSLRGVVLAAICLFLGQYIKELVIFGWLLAVFEMWRGQNTRYLKHFVGMSVVGASVFLWMRSQVVVTPPLVQILTDVDLLLCLLRESLWTPVWALVRPDLCHLGRYTLVNGEGTMVLTLLAFIFWAAIVYYLFKLKKKEGWMLFITFWMFWSLALPNSLMSIEYLTDGQPTKMMYVPDHLLFFPFIVLLFPLFRRFNLGTKISWLAMPVLLLVLVVSGLKVEEWKSQQTLFESWVDKRPLQSKPYEVLGKIYYVNKRIEKAQRVFQLGIDANFKNSELFRLNAICLFLLNRGADAELYIAEAQRLMNREVEKALKVYMASPNGRQAAINFVERYRKRYPKNVYLLKKSEVLRSSK